MTNTKPLWVIYPQFIQLALKPYSGLVSQYLHLYLLNPHHPSKWVTIFAVFMVEIRIMDSLDYRIKSNKVQSWIMEHLAFLGIIALRVK